MRVVVYAVVGYVVYAVGTVLLVAMDPKIWLAAVPWATGLLVSFTFAASEIFFIQAWSLDQSALRRIAVSGVITLVSAVVGGVIFEAAGFRPTYHDALVRYRLAIELPVYILLAFAVRQAFLHAQQKSSD